ncbi:hypothetical protein VP01_1064g7 [Puccinia sorghi]|uniref:Mitochondrial import receptor subunit TOM20 n=1 Tax=Puccinia sorghi TaxID=27349 RepID=A0A0L6VV72_9BASI|nr:hypothetical protein VP01_1064g7 [Puccinia sorghi]
MTSTRQLLTIGGISVLTAGLTYCLYFDYKRRNDPFFRKELLKEQRRLVKKNQAQDRNASRELEKMLEAAVTSVNAEPLPSTVEGKEQFFMEQVGIGEMLASKMPRGAMPAAIAFFKAYKVYPSPQELMVIYQRTMPPEIFAIIVEMIKLDVNRVINSARNSYRSPGHRSQSSSDGPVIEEITGDERALIDALKSVAASGSPSATVKPTSDESKPTSGEPKPISAESNPTSSESKPTPADFKPATDEPKPTPDERKPTPDEPKLTSDDESKPTSGELTGEHAATQPTPPSENPTGGYALTETASVAPSENGSATGASQAAHSFVLVDGDSPVQAQTSEESMPKATEEQNAPSDHVNSTDQPHKEASQEADN